MFSHTCACHFHSPDQQGVKHCAIKSSVYAQAGPLQDMNTIAINTEDRLHVFSHLQSSVNEFLGVPRQGTQEYPSEREGEDCCLWIVVHIQYEVCN